jgi:hypothetical protein
MFWEYYLYEILMNKESVLSHSGEPYKFFIYRRIFLISYFYGGLKGFQEN